MTEQALRGLVIDWGGVLTASLDGAMAAWAARDGVTFAHFEDAMRAWARPADQVADQVAVDHAVDHAAVDEAAEGPVAELEESDAAAASPVHRLERGELAGADFEQVLAVELARRGSPVRAQGLLARMLGGLDALDDDMLGMVRRAHVAGVRTALLSNSWGNAYPPELWDGLFDTLVISGEVGMRKPEPEIFRHTCALLDLPPSACVMVDDLPHNIAGAAGVGMVGVLHTAYATTVEELEILLDLPLR